MYINLTKNDLQKMIAQLTGVAADELELLEAIASFCDDPAEIKNAKILFLVGCGKLYPVNGVSFDNKQDVVKDIKDNDILNFIREPENEHDKNAIKVMFDAQHIGYIPKKVARLLQDCIDDLCGQVIHVVGDKDCNQSMGLRFIFRRKDSIAQKRIVNIDSVSYLLDDIKDTNKSIIARAQMHNIINNEHQLETTEATNDAPIMPPAVIPQGTAAETTTSVPATSPAADTQTTTPENTNKLDEVSDPSEQEQACVLNQTSLSPETITERVAPNIQSKQEEDVF